MNSPTCKKRPRNASQLAKAMVDIATGEVEDLDLDEGKNKATKELGRMGGKACADKVSEKRRAEIAKGAVNARWRKVRSR